MTTPSEQLTNDRSRFAQRRRAWDVIFALVMSPAIALAVCVALVLLRAGPAVYLAGIIVAPLVTTLKVRAGGASLNRGIALALGSVIIVVLIVLGYFVALLMMYDQVMDGF